MEDLELLELAARAIGEEFHSGHCTVNGQQFEWVEWNPLTDDGDALRLAVKLRIEILQITNWNGQFVVCGGIEAEQIANDPYVATRRAIVRAAAEIAKQQPIAEGYVNE